MIDIWKVSPVIKVRGAFLGLGIFFPLLSYFLDQWHNLYLFLPILSVIVGERLLYEVNFALRKARHLLKTLDTSQNKHSYQDDLRILSDRFSEVIADYNPTKRVATLLKDKEDIVNALQHEIIIKGRYNSGQYTCGKIWNKPEGVLLEGPAEHSGLSYKHKLRLWKSSVETTLKELEAIENNLKNRKENALAGIIRFQIIMLLDKSLQNKVKRGLGPAPTFSYGVKSVLEPIRKQLKNPNPKFDRSADLQDLEQRLLRAANRKTQLDLQQQVDLTGKIILCKTILPTEILQYAKQGANGFIVLQSEITSHSLILLKSMNMHAVTGFNLEHIDIADDTDVILDGPKGYAIFRPTEEKLKIYEDLIKDDSLHLDLSDEPVSLKNNEKFYVRANLSLIDELPFVANSKPNGIGLFRSELEFMLYDVMPPIEEQISKYKKIADTFQNQTIVLRVLDTGGDKNSLHQESFTEENPSLGFKAIRYLLSEPKILEDQIEAMSIALLEKGGYILIPMISCVEEAQEVHQIYIKTLSKLGNISDLKNKVKLGLMVETPSSVVILDKLAPFFELFSIGTNDLTQYTLAADRNNSHVAPLYSKISPAVIRSIHRICQIGKENQIPVCICGQLGQNIQLLPIFIGFGLREVSINHNEVQNLKLFIKTLQPEQCEKLAQKVLDCSTEQEIQQLLETNKEYICQQN